MVVERAAHAATIHAQFEANRTRLTRELERTIHHYERRYEVPSDRLEGELSAGRIRETSEIASWVVAWRALQRLRGAAG